MACLSPTWTLRPRRWPRPRRTTDRRLAQLMSELAAEFEAQRCPEEICACADAVLARYDDARIRSHVLTLAHRQTRECLRAETCDALAVTR